MPDRGLPVLPEGSGWTKAQAEQATLAVAMRHGLPPALFTALIWQESRFNTKALSPKGAFGLAQLMPDTAKGLRVDRKDPLQNLNGGARYLKEQFKRFGSWRLALAAYNAGPGAVQKHNGVPPFRETQNYVQVIMAKAGIKDAASPVRRAEVVTDATPKHPPNVQEFN